jgi:hypothetical protein
VNEHPRCPKHRTAQLLCPAQAGTRLAGRPAGRPYLATPRPGGVPHPPTQREEQLSYPDETPAYPPGRQASQPKALLRLPVGQVRERKKRVHMDEYVWTVEEKNRFARKDRVRLWA